MERTTYHRIMSHSTFKCLTKTVSPVKSVGASTSLPISSARALSDGNKIDAPIIPILSMAGTEIELNGDFFLGVSIN